MEGVPLHCLDGEFTRHELPVSNGGSAEKNMYEFKQFVSWWAVKESNLQPTD